MSTPPLLPSPVYGLRTWAAAGPQGEERLTGPRVGTPWPTGGAWLEARCDHGHSAPSAGCDCGIHAWHPGPHGARRVLSLRWEIPGVVETEGAIELHQDGFRAERGRPYALFVAPHANARRARRLADAYGIEAVGVDGPAAIVAWCRARGLGLAPDVVEELLGPEAIAEARRTRRARIRNTRIRIAAVLAAIAVLIGVGLATTGTPADCTLFGRTGEIRVC
jgi:hypothetical protein